MYRRRWNWALLLVWLAVGASSAQNPHAVEAALKKLAALPPDPCETHDGAGEMEKHPETPVFLAATALMQAQLNQGDEPPLLRLQSAVAAITLDSRKVLAHWPEESRFHAKVVEAGPLLITTMFVGARERWFAFGKVEGRWKQVGEDGGGFDDSPRRLMQVYHLPAGRPGVARFLAARVFFGCAGSSGISYEVREWDPAAPGGYVATVFSQDGAFGMDEAADGRAPSAQDPFAPIGKLVTDGPVLALPYCTFTSIDTWDNPSLCTLDRYDVRGATLRFLSRRYNRPELVPVAKAMEYAAAHDLPATRAYCASEELARRLVFEGAPAPDTNVEVVRHGQGKRVWFGDRESWFDVERRAGRWVIVGLSPSR